MIHYDSKRAFGLPLLFQLYGSSFPKAFFLGLASALLTILVWYNIPKHLEMEMKNPLAFQVRLCLKDYCPCYPNDGDAMVPCSSMRLLVNNLWCNCTDCAVGATAAAAKITLAVKGNDRYSDETTLT